MTKSKLLSFGKTTVYGFQHMFAMLGATILVPILANMSISVALISAGCGTIAFYFITKRKVPVFLGSSFAFLPAFLTAIPLDKPIGSPEWNTAMGAVSIAIVLAGMVFFVFALIIKKVGIQSVKKVFPPIVIGPVIIIIGMILAPKMFYNNIFAQYVSYGSVAWKEWTTALVTVATIIGFNAYAKPKSFLKVIPILLGFIVGYLYALIIGLISFDGVFSGDILIFQQLKQNFGFYGSLNINWSIILSIVPLSIITFMEHLGDISANSIICGKDFMVDPGIHRTLIGDGVGAMIGGFLGAPESTTYGENTAVLVITENYDPKNIFVAAIITVICGIFVPFGEFLSTIPSSVIGGASIVLFGMIAASGLRNLVDNKVDFSNSKNLIVVSVILAIGLGFSAVSLVGDVTGNMAYKVMIGSVEFSPLAIATLVGIMLNLFIPDRKKVEQDEHEKLKKIVKEDSDELIEGLVDGDKI